MNKVRSLRSALAAHGQNMVAHNGGGGGGGEQVALLDYLGLCLSVLGLGYLVAADALQYRALVQEDSVVENLTAVWLGLAGLVLLFAAGGSGALGRRGVYVLGGLALVFGAGEEISWGQQLFGFATPGFLQAVNYQGEFTVHNIGAANTVNTVIQHILQYATLLLCTATGAAFVCRKDTLGGIPLPSMPLLLGFLVMLAHYPGTVAYSANPDIPFVFWHPDFLFRGGNHLLLLLACYTLFSRQPGWFMLIATTGLLVLAVSYVNQYNPYPGKINEMREYLFGFLCLGYALELGLGPGGRNTAPAGPVWRTVCAGVVVASVGLMGFQYVRIRTEARTEAAFIERTYQALAAQTPVVRAAFAVYLRDNRLIYFKEPCAPADTEAPFILHLVPADPDSLPRARRAYGFDNWDFRFREKAGMHAAGKCLVIIPLPEYDIVRMRVGQRRSGEPPLWQAEFAVRPTAAAFIERTSQVLAAQVPVVRAAFAVYLIENRLIYFKEPCAPADTEAPFVLHLVPADPDSLPRARQAYGFDNRDFRFREQGGMHAAGKCLVIIPLPEYDIVRMRVGQWLPAAQRTLWQADFAVRE